MVRVSQAYTIHHILYTIYSTPLLYTTTILIRPRQVDKYIYGHPSHGIFRSVWEFLPHFGYLATYQDGDVCQCRLCEMAERRRARKAAGAEARAARRTAAAAKRAKVKVSFPASLLSLSTSFREEEYSTVEVEPLLICVLNQNGDQDD